MAAGLSPPPLIRLLILLLLLPLLPFFLIMRRRRRMRRWKRRPRRRRQIRRRRIIIPPPAPLSPYPRNVKEERGMMMIDKTGIPRRPRLLPLWLLSIIVMMMMTGLTPLAPPPLAPPFPLPLRIGSGATSGTFGSLRRRSRRCSRSSRRRRSGTLWRSIGWPRPSGGCPRVRRSRPA